MLDTEKLVLGIDLCDDITQVTVMRPRAAEPDAVCFDARTRKEFLPTLLYENSDGEWSVGEEPEPGATVLPPFFRAAVKNEAVETKSGVLSGRELLEHYISILLQKVSERFDDREIGFAAVTYEAVKDGDTAKTMLYDIFENKQGFSGSCLVLSHLEAFLHFVIRQEVGLWENGSAAFDYSEEGLLFYRMECRMAGGRRLLVADCKDYSEVLPAEVVTRGEHASVAAAFERLAEMSLQQRYGSLFATGRVFEGEWVSDVLRMFSRGRRVFRGQNLYTQGACYAGTEVFRQEGNVDFSLLTPEQITVDVFLMAETAEQEDGVLLAKAGEAFRKVDTRKEVLLNGTDRLSFKIVPAGETTPMLIRVAPSVTDLRGDSTNRYQVRLFFVKRDVMVIQLKDTGFGVFYPSTHRIYEEIVDFSHME